MGVERRFLRELRRKFKEEGCCKNRVKLHMDKIFDLIEQEEIYQNDTIRLIPSENFVSENVKRALASGLTNKYAEGYPGKRYYQGNKIVDEIENLAIERGKKLFESSI